MTSTLLSECGRLVTALVLGALVGYQRERHGHPAGLRTHMLVALGAALITIVSRSFHGPATDPSRIAAQIVSGIGFLGAGTIIRSGQSIRGLTTAASLWTVAGIGIGAGRGDYLLWLAVFTTVLALATLTIMDVVEERFITSTERRDLVIQGTPEALSEALAMLSEEHVAIRDLEIASTGLTGAQRARLRVVLPPRLSTATLLERMARIDGVARVGWAQDNETDV